MTSSLFSSEEMSTAFNLRTNTINGYKMCFTKAYPDDKSCKLGCSEEDSISHSYSCKVINMQDVNSSGEYSSLFSSIVDQKQAVKSFIRRNNIRTAILEAGCAYQGTSTPAGGARERLGD